MNLTRLTSGACNKSARLNGWEKIMWKTIDERPSFDSKKVLLSLDMPCRGGGVKEKVVMGYWKSGPGIFGYDQYENVSFMVRYWMEIPDTPNTLNETHNISMQECYKAFCEFHPDGKDLYPTYSDWLFSKDEKAVSFRQGWAAANKNQQTERS